VLLGDHPDVHERIECSDATQATWGAMSVTFAPSTLPAEAEADLDALYRHAANGDAAAASNSAAVLAELPATAISAHNGNGSHPDVDSTPRHDLLVRVLGEVTIEGHAAHLTAAEVELLALLASLRAGGPINIDRLATLLAHDEWRTPNPSTIKARISMLRTKLGVGRDGTPLLPAATTRQNSPGRYHVSPLVITDVDLLERSDRTSLDLPSGEAIASLWIGLHLVRGKPYTARTGYTWANDEQAVLRAQHVVVDATAHLIELLGEVGDTQGVDRAAIQAARAIDDPLTQLPYRRAQARVAAATGDLALVGSVLAYRRELQDYLDDTDPLFETDAPFDALLQTLTPARDKT
jgi:hypothetical protein